MGLDADVIVVGGGIAGLSCARTLCGAGLSVRILEASEWIGGRIRSDRMDGFILDRGFQVLQSAYPEARRQLDYSSLNLMPFEPGAIFRIGERFHTVSHPLRRPLDFWSTLAAPVGTLEDKLRLVALAAGIRRAPLSDLFEAPDVNVKEKLKNQGYSSIFIKRFINPFLSSITLDSRAEVSWRFFLFVLAMFSTGDVALPADGMGEIPRILAAGLPASWIQTRSAVRAVSPGRATLSDGRHWTGRAVVVATDESAHFRLFHTGGARRCMPATCVYYSVSRPPFHRPFLVLNADEDGPIASVVVPSLAAPNYSPPGAHLVAVTALSKTQPLWPELAAAMERQLRRWYGEQVREWRQLAAYFIPHGLPAVAPPLPSPYRQPVRMEKGLFHCGETMGVPSIQWALYSGRRAAEAVIAELKGTSDGSVNA